MTLQTPCGHASVADALATGLSEIHVQVLGDNIQYVTPAPAPNTDYYANGLNVGPVTFNSGQPVEPTSPAPTPPVRYASDVLSVYSDAYTQIANVNLNPNWGQSTAVTEVPIDGDLTLKLANLNYQGIDWASTPIDVTAMTRLHVDVWTPDVTTLNVSVISDGQENAVSLSPTAAGWNSYDIDMALYTVPDKSAVIQLKSKARRPLARCSWTTTTSVAAVVLAAGGSPRMGSPKPLLSHGGRSLLRRAIDVAHAASCAPIVVVNPGAALGPRDLKPSPTGHWLVEFLNRRLDALLPGGFNIVHVRDVAMGHLLAAEKGKPGERYILGNCEGNWTMQETLSLLSQVTGIRAPTRR